jgi:hypothetical protein
MNCATLNQYNLLLALLIMLLGGCAGVQTFPNTVRAGDTAALAAGWKSDFSRSDITVTITDSTGAQTIYPPGSPEVRAVINFYPDPLSSIAVASRGGVELTPYAGTYAQMVNYRFTQEDPDWWQTVVFVDLPPTLPPGNTVVSVKNAAGVTSASTIEVIDGTGKPAVFNAQDNGPLHDLQLASLERAPHYEITFAGNQIPHALELRLAHDPDASNGGSGQAYIINPRGETKNLMWSGNGTHLHVILTPAGMSAPPQMIDYKFYITGGITGVYLINMKAFDEVGGIIPDVTMTLRSRN